MISAMSCHQVGRGDQAGFIKMHRSCRAFHPLPRPRVEKARRRKASCLVLVSGGRGHGTTPITNSPQAWGTPSLRGRTKENLAHFFGHHRLTTHPILLSPVKAFLLYIIRLKYNDGLQPYDLTSFLSQYSIRRILLFVVSYSRCAVC